MILTKSEAEDKLRRVCFSRSFFGSQDQYKSEPWNTLPIFSKTNMIFTEQRAYLEDLPQRQSPTA